MKMRWIGPDGHNFFTIGPFVVFTEPTLKNTLGDYLFLATTVVYPQEK